MRANILILLVCLDISFCYYAMKLKEINLTLLSNNTNVTNNVSEINSTLQAQLDELEEYLDLPLNNSELNIINESYIPTKNLNQFLYAADVFLGSNMKFFRLVLSTFDDYTTISSENCTSCNVLEKYDSSLSNTSVQIIDVNNNLNVSPDYSYKLFQDSCFVPSESSHNGVKETRSISMDKLLLKVIESDTTGFLNSNTVDGILSLSYNNDSSMPNSNFIRELYNEGKISSPSFSVFITSSKVNRLYLGDIMKNEYIQNFVSNSMNKGECSIIDNSWKCKVKILQYADFIYDTPQNIFVSSNVSFDLKQDSLIIPYKYFYEVIVGYKVRKSGRSYMKRNKACTWVFGGIQCSCKGKDSFGVMTLHFENRSKIDIDLRNYVTYDPNAIFYQCQIDAKLGNDDEFVIGLKGLNNTILSFNMDEKKIEFFHKKKTSNNDYKLPWTFIAVIASIIVIVLLI